MLSLVPRAAPLAAALLPLVAVAAPLTIDEAVGRAAQRSEAARSAQAGVLSASEAARSSGQLPDPMLGVSVENLPVTGADRFRTTRESMTMKRIALSQEWVSRDKRALRSDAAQAAVAREVASAGTAVAYTRLQAALAFVDAYYAREAALLGAETEHHAMEAAQAARVRMSSGAAGAQDVLALTAAQGMGADEAAEAQQQVASTSVALARWVGAPAAELAAPALAGAWPEQAWTDSHPAVVAKRREVDLARKEAAVVAANRHPNWSWEVSYGQRTGFSDLVSLGVNIPLPVAPASRQDRETASKLALVGKAEADLAETTRMAEAEYRALASDAQRLEQRIQAYEAGVLAPTRQRYATARAGLAANQGSLAGVFEARHAQVEAQRKLLALRRDLARVRAQLTFKPLRAEDLQ